MKSAVSFICIFLVWFPQILIGKMDFVPLPDSLPSTIFQKLVANQYTELELIANFDSLIANKKFDDELAAKLILKSRDKPTLQMALKIRARGVFRRQFCEMPPLRFNFNDGDLEQMGLNSEFDKLKLVTHCVANSDSEQVLLKEYWAYQLHQIITSHSFKTHLVKITYVNSQNKEDRKEKLAFLIENNREIANRLGGELVEKFGVTAEMVTAETHQTTMLFNYMIGNLDWKLYRQRNIKFVQSKEKDKLMVIPYDFDLCALVRPSYAVLNADYKQKRFEDRYCVGRFPSEAALFATIQKFQNLKEKLLNAFMDDPFLNKKSKKKMQRYLASFYKPLDDKEQLRKIFLE